MHVETVVWITERKGLLYSLFYMAALLMYVHYVRRPVWYVYAGALVCGLLSILAKPLALSLPFVLSVCDWFYRRGNVRRCILEKIPFLFLLTPIAMVTYALNADLAVRDVSFLKSFLILIWTLSFYIQKFFIPGVLVPDYSLPYPISLLNAAYGGAIVTIIVLIFLMIRFRREKLVLFAFFYYLASIFFMLRMTGVITKSLVADRYMYLPSVGICILLGVLIERCYEHQSSDSFRRLRAVGLGLICILVLCWKTYGQIGIWRNSISLWNHEIAHAPAKHFHYYNRADAYFNLGDIEMALADFNKALEMDPYCPDAHNKRGLIYLGRGQDKLALADFDATLKLAPDYANAYENRGFLFHKNKQWASAMRDYDQAVSIDPYAENVYSNRGSLHLSMGNYGLALADFNRAIEIDPAVADFYKNRATVYYARKERELAQNDLQYALYLEKAGPEKQSSLESHHSLKVERHVQYSHR